VEKIIVSNINYLSINEQFPVPGQDNDTQVFRDNFDTIKQSLRIAKDEITVLEGNTAGLELTKIEGGSGESLGSDFGSKILENAITRAVREYKNPPGVDAINTLPLPESTGVVEIDFKSGSYQVCRFTDDVTMIFTNFPGDVFSVDIAGGVGKVILELYSDSDNEETGVRTIEFSTSAGTEIRKSGFPEGDLTVNSTTNPVIIELWRHGSNKIFMKYIGLFE
jgi:hypothetical protein